MRKTLLPQGLLLVALTASHLSAQVETWRTVTVQLDGGATARAAWRPALPTGPGLYPAYLIATSTMETTGNGIPRMNSTPNAGPLGDRMGVLGADIVASDAKSKWGIEIVGALLDGASRMDAALMPGQEATLLPRLSWNYVALRGVRQVLPMTLRIRLLLNGSQVDEVTMTLRMHDFGDVPYALVSNGVVQDQSWMFAAFLDESSPVIDTLLREALNSGVVSSFDGYQRGPQAVTQQVFALWHVLQRRGFRYSNIVTPSAPNTGMIAQHVRTVGEALATSQANCVEGTLLLASALRRIGIDPVLIKVPGHMYLGYRLASGSIESGFVETTMMGSADLRALPEEGTLTGALTTLFGRQTATRASLATFNAAVTTASQAFQREQAKFNIPGSGFIVIDVAKVRNSLGLLPAGSPSPPGVLLGGSSEELPFRPGANVTVEAGRFPGVATPVATIANAGASSTVWQIASLKVPNLSWKSKAFEASGVACRLKGTIEGVSGGKKDVIVSVLSDAAYQAWGERDLADPEVLRSFDRGSKTEIDMVLPAVGRYWVLINNQFSILTAKLVDVELRIVC